MRAGMVLSAVFAVSLAILSAQDGKTPSIFDVMQKAHKTKTGLRAQIAAEVDKCNPDWADIQKKSKEWVTLISALPKNEPPKGTKASWEKLTSAYLTNVKTLDEAAGKKDATAVKAVNKKLGAACMGCHDAHREE